MRRVFTLANQAIRQRVLHFVRSAPDGYRVEIRETKRSDIQSRKMWTLLDDVAAQVEHHGRRYSSNVWKIILMHELGYEAEFVPSLNGTEIIPLGYRSSELTKTEMSDLIELIYKEGAERGVVWSEPEQERAA